MPTMQEVRQKYPQYQDLSDEQLADALHKKFYSDMPQEEFSAKIGLTPPSPVTQFDLMTAPPKGDPGQWGIPQEALDLVTMEGASKLNAAGGGLIDATMGAIKGDGFNYSDAYNKHLAQRRADQSAYQEQNPVKSVIGKGLGVGLGIGNLPGVAAKATTYLAGARAAAETGGLYGAAGGAMQDANSASERLYNTGKGATIGAGLGGSFGALIPPVMAAGRAVAKPVTSYFNPAGAADKFAGKALKQAGQSPQTMRMDLQDAASEGQAGYTVADAMGTPGQRLLSSITRTPNNARAQVIEQLNRRQGTQGRRIASQLEEGFGNPSTAMQDISKLKADRTKAGNVNYGAARGAAAADVDTGAVLKKIDDIASPALRAFSISPDTVGGAVGSIRSRLVSPDGNAKVTDFDTLLGIRRDAGDMVDAAFRSGKNAQGKALKEVVKELDAALAKSSQPYRNALQQYAKDSRVIDAVDTGKAAAMRGRTEDTIPAFNKLGREEQDAFRAGYSDPLIEATQGAAFGVDKSRPLINDATAAEFPAIAGPYRADKLQRQLGREQRMFETRNAATGGSGTAQNLEDNGAIGGVMKDLATKGIMGTVKNVAINALSSMVGKNEGVREELAKILMETDPVRAADMLSRALARTNTLQARQANAIRAAIVSSSLAQNSIVGRNNSP